MSIFEYDVLKRGVLMSQISVLKAMADESRLRILCLLSEESLCVCEIEAMLSLLQSNVSRHLNKLTTSKLLKYSKRNKYIYYELDQDWVQQQAPFVIEALENEKKTNPQAIMDLERLRDYKNGNTQADDVAMQHLCWNMTGKGCCESATASKGE